MASDIVFWVLSVLAVGAALAVVLLRNIFRAALSMVLCFFMVAGLYASLGADFLAMIQLLIYVGAISILIIIAIMLTRGVWQAGAASSVGAYAVLAFFLFGSGLVFSLLRSNWLAGPAVEPQPTTSELGLQLFGQSGYVLTLEISAVLLLAAVIGAMVLIRDK